MKDNPLCEDCAKAEAVVCCSDGVWRCAECCALYGYSIITGNPLGEDYVEDLS